MSAAFHPLVRAGENGVFCLPDDGFVMLMPLGEFPGEVRFGSVKPEGVEGAMQDESGRWFLPIVQVIDAESVAACAASHRPDTLIDYEHNANRPDGETRAAGWTEAVEARPDGLWVKIRWSADGLADVTGGNYRYLSPVFPWSTMEHLGGNRYRARSFDGAALTNTPNLRTIKAVSNALSPRVGSAGTAPDAAVPHQEKTENMKQLIQALGLPPEATEDDILKAIGDIQQRLAQLEAEKAEAQAEEDLKALGDRVENRAALKEALLRDREGTLKIINALKAPKAIALNARAVKTPEIDIAKSVSDLAQEQERAVEEYRIKNKCSRKEAWNAVRRARPELFTTQKEN